MKDRSHNVAFKITPQKYWVQVTHFLATKQNRFIHKKLHYKNNINPTYLPLFVNVEIKI